MRQAPSLFLKPNFLLILLLTALALPMEAQTGATPDCFLVEDISETADDALMEIEDLPFLLQEVKEVDAWDEDEGTQADGLRDAIAVVRENWGKMHLNAGSLVKDWNAVKPLAKSGCRFEKKYKKAAKYLSLYEEFADKGANQLKEPIEKWSLQERAKAMSDMKNLMKRSQKALQSFSKMSLSLSDACDKCNPDPDDFR